MDVNIPSEARHAGQAPRRTGWRKVLGMFNLNDPRGGRGNDSGQGEEQGSADNGRQEERGPQRDPRPPALVLAWLLVWLR